MTDTRPPFDGGIDRRGVLRSTWLVAMATLAGCGGDGAGESTDECGDAPSDLDQPVPEVYQGATSKGDLERDPSRLLSKSEGDYQREPNGDQRCERCSYYVPDKNGDCLGACVRIEGLVDPDGWCTYYRTQVGGGW